MTLSPRLRALRVGLATLAAVLFAGCALPTRESALDSAARTAPIEFPSTFYEQALSRGQPLYRIDPARSVAVITVRRGGSLGRLGHDHVVASRHVQGLIAPADGRADLYVPLAELSVDEPSLRTEAGLDTQPSEADIAATRANMLDKVLEVQRFPFALVRVSGPATMTPGAQFGIEITLHGTTRRFDLPVRIAMAEDELNVTGTLDFDQSEFGIVPFSVLGGAIQVQDRLRLRFSVEARRAAKGDVASPWPMQ